MFAAAEAVIEALLVVDREARRLLVVERAEAGELRARAPLQRDLAADDVAETQSGSQLVEEARGEGHALKMTLAASYRYEDSGDGLPIYCGGYRVVTFKIMEKYWTLFKRW